MTELDRWVALKVLPRAKENRNFIERFYREARSAARLVHPNIIQIHTVSDSLKSAGGRKLFHHREQLIFAVKAAR